MTVSTRPKQREVGPSRVRAVSTRGALQDSSSHSLSKSRRRPVVVAPNPDTALDPKPVSQRVSLEAATGLRAAASV